MFILYGIFYMNLTINLVCQTMSDMKTDMMINLKDTILNGPFVRVSRS